VFESRKTHRGMARKRPTQTDIDGRDRRRRPFSRRLDMEELDIAIIGAGPTGLATAIEAHRRGLTYLVFDKGCITNSILGFPTHMVFFTTPELLEIGGLPLTSDREKPTRNEALKYYRKIVQALNLKV